MRPRKPVLEEQVAGDSAEGAGEQIHQTGEARQGRSVSRCHLVHGEFCPKASRVLKDHGHYTKVLENDQVVHRRRLLGLSGDGHVEALGQRGVPAQQLDACCTDQEHHHRHDHGNPPGRIRDDTRLDHWVEKDGHHEDLSHTTPRLPQPAAVAFAVPMTFGTPRLRRQRR